MPDPGDLARRPEWLTAAAGYASGKGFLAFCYYDASISNPWWLRCVRDPEVADARSIAAWSRVYREG